MGEYAESELRDNPIFTVSDGLIWLYQSIERNSIVRKMQIMKLRGQESISDAIVRLRYVSINGQLRKMLRVVKMRGSAHSIDMWEFEIADQGIVIGDPFRGYRALTSGIPEPLPSGGDNRNGE